MQTEQNLAFIDGQNLYLGTTQNGWTVDFMRFRTYLLEKYSVKEAAYFFGFVDESQQDLYTNLQRAGFIVCFREHHSALKATKKGNVDTDIVFEAMRALIDRDDFDKILLVSGDGDYKKLVSYLIEKERFKRILFPNSRYASSLYKNLGHRFFDSLDRKDVRMKIEYKKKRGP